MESTKSPVLGGSLAVPCVQELAKQHKATVPPRYVRPDQNPTSAATTDLSFRSIPVIDLQILLNSDASSDLQLQQLHSACKEWGFFQRAMESAKSPVLGGSLAVPCVQELAKQHKATVPPRYVRPDQNPTSAATTDLSFRSIPVIDLQILLNSDASSDLQLQQLHSACKEWGFFQLVNHGINNSVVETMKSEIEGFFRLPLEEKQKLKQLHGDVEGYGQAFVVSEDQKLDWADMFYLVSLPVEQRKEHIFSNLSPSFREAIEAYAAELRKLAMFLFKLMAICLGMKSGEMEELFEGGFQSMRMNYYPPCPQPELVMGLTPHSDSVGLTLLLQVNEIQGLQIRKDGSWLGVKPLPNAFIVNIGDILEIVSNGVYRSIEHRAIVNSTQERMSIATFYSPDYKGEMGPAHSLVSQENPALFKRLSVEHYFNELFNRKLEGKSYLDSLRIDNGCDM